PPHDHSITCPLQSASIVIRPAQVTLANAPLSGRNDSVFTLEAPLTSSDSCIKSNKSDDVLLPQNIPQRDHRLAVIVEDGLDRVCGLAAVVRDQAVGAVGRAAEAARRAEA